jgi:hypothetical protein
MYYNFDMGRLVNTMFGYIASDMFYLFYNEIQKSETTDILDLHIIL